MMRPDAKLQKVYLYTKPVEFRSSNKWPGYARSEHLYAL